MGFGRRFRRALRRVGRVAKKSVGIQARIAAPVKPAKVVKAVKRATKTPLGRKFIFGVSGRKELAIGAAVGSAVALSGAAGAAGGASGAGAAGGAASTTSGIAASAAAINEGVKKITGNTAVELAKQAAIEKRRSRQVIAPSNSGVDLSAPQVPVQASVSGAGSGQGINAKTLLTGAGLVLGLISVLK